jgi:hypothetical protein
MLLSEQRGGAPMTIHLPAELEARIEREASEQGKNPEQWLADLIESELGAPPKVPDYPRWSEEEVQALIAASGVKPLTAQDLAIDPKVAEEMADFDVDEFLEARRQWKLEEIARDRRRLDAENGT